ncbi:MAG: hypothetical protein HKN80_11065 [Acidimicrobiia bacterium]|nr:hypothetical protein [Acidimicrobiia bacterium]
MGYVSTGPFPAEGADHELPGRQHRRARARYRALASRRVARFGESLAAAYLVEHGAKIVGRNVRAGRGEIDLLLRMQSRLVAVEVKTRVGSDPRPSYTVDKADHVWETVRRLQPRPSRVDLVAIALTADGATIRWLPGVR